MCLVLGFFLNFWFELKPIEEPWIKRSTRIDWPESREIQWGFHSEDVQESEERSWRSPCCCRVITSRWHQCRRLSAQLLILCTPEQDLPSSPAGFIHSEDSSLTHLHVNRYQDRIVFWAKTFERGYLQRRLQSYECFTLWHVSLTSSKCSSAFSLILEAAAEINPIKHKPRLTFTGKSLPTKQISSSLTEMVRCSRTVPVSSLNFNKMVLSVTFDNNLIW